MSKDQAAGQQYFSLMNKNVMVDGSTTKSQKTTTSSVHKKNSRQ